MPEPGTLLEPSFDANALRVLNERYFAVKPDGSKETPKEFLWRVASAIGSIEANFPDSRQESITHDFYEMMARRDFMPNTPCLVNAGRPLSMLSACFVLPVDDSIDNIFTAIRSMALIQKGGGGIGYAFSRLRHKGAAVKTTGRDASGPLSFMKVFNAATDSIKQGGVRRGANMGVLRVDHPDILDFINAKKDLDNENRALWNRFSDTGRYTPDQLAHMKQELLQTQFNNFNLSVGITDAFMSAVERDAPFDLIDPATKSVVQTVPAKLIWNAIVDGAWQNGEPGILFLDHPTVNPLPGLGPIEASNPCGEQLLHGFDACTLGSINLGNFVSDSAIEWGRLSTTVHKAIRFLDDVVDAGIYPLPEITEMVRNNRRIGLGIMGFADLLIRLHISYGSADSILLAEEIMRFIKRAAEDATEQLARERGNFPNKHLSIWKDDPRPRRNAALLSIAPTGTISMIAGCSFGCEPYFGLAYTKNVLKDKEGRAQRLYYVVPLFEAAAKNVGIYSDDLLTAIEERGGSIKGLPDIPPEIRDIFTVTADVSVDQHIDILAAFQKHTCNATSKTINAPNSDTKDSVAHALRRAYHAGCKGFTYYRDGSRTEQVVTFSKQSDLPAAPAAANPSDLDALIAKAQQLLGSST